jgi:V/A-type H+-transporting ATPase subunit F
MYKIVVVTDPDSAPGFRLAGVDVLEASGLDEARKIIPSLIYKDDTGIVAISEDLMPAIDEKMQERSVRPTDRLSFQFPPGSKVSKK